MAKTIDQLKMFVKYSGTKAQFMATSKPTDYKDKVVFIGNGECIFAKGMYFANFAELIAALNYVKGVSVDGKQYNAAQGGGYVAFGATDPATVAVNAGQDGISIGLTSAFINKVNDTATNLGTSADAANKDGSAFARIANLAALVSDLTGGSTDSIEGQITNAINALRTEIVGTLGDGDAQTLQAINDELDTLGLSIKSISDDYLKASDKTELENKIKANADAIDAVEADIATLNGNDATEGSVAKQIKDAINDFATKVSDDNTVNTFKELVDYAAENASDLAGAIADINTNKGNIANLRTADDQLEQSIEAVTERFQAHDENSEIHVTAEDKSAWNAKYDKPSTGIPTADIANKAVTIDKVDDAIKNILETSVLDVEGDNYVAANNTNGKVSLTANVQAVDSTSTGLVTNSAVAAYIESVLGWIEE